MTEVKPFTTYQKYVIAMLAFLQFTVIFDFQIISPLGAELIPALKITPGQFGLVVSAYAFAAGLSSFLTAGFADRFDRKKLLLFFYGGFILGTFVCGLAPGYELLLAARVFTGIFGGVISSILLAIAADLFALQQRGRVMGVLQTAFGASQILGLPAGLYFSGLWGWHAPFLMIVLIGLFAGFFIAYKMEPVNAHLALQHPDHNPYRHLIQTLRNPRYALAFINTGLMTTGAYMMMPFATTFAVNNLKIPFERLPFLYLSTGLASIFLGPLIGRAADRFGKFNVFVAGALFGIPAVIYYSHMGPSALWLLVLVQIWFFIGIFMRVIPAQALISALPSPDQRGSFMSVNSSLQQLSGGLSSLLAGYIVYQNADGQLQNFDLLGYILCATALVTVVFMYYIRRIVEPPTASTV